MTKVDEKHIGLLSVLNVISISYENNQFCLLQDIMNTRCSNFNNA